MKKSERKRVKKVRIEIYLNFRIFAIFASGSILGSIFPFLEVNRVVTPGSCPEIMQSV